MFNAKVELLTILISLHPLEQGLLPLKLFPMFLLNPSNFTFQIKAT
jgi:hypothetical protein